VNNQFVNSAIYVLLAALGGSAITGVALMEAGRRAARHTDRAELAARRLEAYANLLVAAGDVLGTYRRNRDALSRDFGLPRTSTRRTQMKPTHTWLTSPLRCTGHPR
jgi:hypothetical protein